MKMQSEINIPFKARFSSRNCTIAIDLLLLLTIFGTIAIGIAIAKDTSRLLLLVLLLLRGLFELLLLIAIFTIGQLCSSCNLAIILAESVFCHQKRKHWKTDSKLSHDL